MVPALFQQRGHELAIDGVVLGEQHLQPSARPRGRWAARPGLGRRVETPEDGGERIEEIRMLDRLRQERVDCHPAFRGVVAVPDRHHHHDRDARRALVRVLMRRASMKPSTAGIWRSATMTSNGSPRPAAVRSASSADSASATDGRRACASSPASPRGFADSSRCHRRRAREGRRGPSCCRRASRVTAPAARSKVAVK